MKVRVIVAEKNSVARKIACSICKNPCSDRRKCVYEHEDIFLHFAEYQPCLNSSRSSSLIDCVRKGKYLHAPFYYRCKRKHCRCFPCHVDDLGKGHATRIRKKIDDLGMEGFEKEYKKEHVKYFELQDEEWKTIILATNGTMLSTHVRKRRSETVAEKIENIAFWNEMSNLLWYQAKKERSKKHNKRIYTHLCTSLLFKSILAEESRGKIDQLIFATDYDIAGSFIALSILEKTQIDRKIKGKEELDESVIKRMILKKLTKQEIERELNELSSFDWGNAYGGKLKSAFDYLFGVPLTSILNNAILEIIGEDFHGLGIGRVKLPALFFIINRDWEAAVTRDTYNIYIVSKGYFSMKDISTSLKNGDIIVFLTKERKTHYSTSQFLVDLAENKIGTHTTRLGQPEKLEDSGLIEIDEYKRICSTPLGLQYNNVLRSRLKTNLIDFASIDFNKKFHEDINAVIATGESSQVNERRLHCEQKFNELMTGYYDNIRVLIPHFQKEARKIAPLLIRYLKCEKKKENKDEPADKSGSFLELEAGDSIPLDYLDKIVDSDGKYKEPQDETLIYQRKFREIDLLQLLRLLLKIPRDTDFTILDIYNRERITEFSEDSCVVFKAVIPDIHSDPTEQFNSIVANLKSIHFEPPLTELIVKKKAEPAGEMAHEPLHTTKLLHRNIPGKEGNLLVREYDRPYIYTIRKLLALTRENGGLVNGFSAGGLNFQPIDSYKPFEAHNYESMLFTMHEKYGWDLERTADLMQKLYEGGEFY